MTVSPRRMRDAPTDKKILRAIYLLCAINTIGLVIAIWVSIRLTDRSIEEMKAMSGVHEDASKEAALIIEFDEMIERGQLAEVKAHTSAILEEKPLSRIAHCYLGFAHYHLGEFDEARTHLERAKDIAPAWIDTIQPYLDAIEG